MNFKKIGKVFTSKFVGTGPSSFEKENLPGRGLSKVEKQWSTLNNLQTQALLCETANGIEHFSSKQHHRITKTTLRGLLKAIWPKVHLMTFPMTPTIRDVPATQQ